MCTAEAGYVTFATYFTHRSPQEFVWSIRILAILNVTKCAFCLKQTKLYIYDFQEKTIVFTGFRCEVLSMLLMHFTALWRQNVMYVVHTALAYTKL